jgi:phenylalanyl-tRNA synthetase beta chain
LCLEGEEFWIQLIPNPAGIRVHDASTVPVRIINPATRDRELLRMTLVPGLLDVIARNVRHTDERLAFCEIDRTYFARSHDLPYERRTLAVALAGRRESPTWQNPNPGPYTFYDIKGLLEAILHTLHIEDWQIRAAKHPSLHPGRAAVLSLDSSAIAYLGELHPAVATAFDIEDQPVQVAEVDLDTLFSHASGSRLFQPLPRYPSARRDIAVVVDAGVPAGEVMRRIREAGDVLLESAHIFDVYRGEPLPDDARSIAVSMEFRAPGATLTQDQVNEVTARIVSTLRQELGASLRE